jgi:hypothetical protein
MVELNQRHCIFIDTSLLSLAAFKMEYYFPGESKTFFYVEGARQLVSLKLIHLYRSLGTFWLVQFSSTKLGTRHLSSSNTETGLVDKTEQNNCYALCHLTNTTGSSTNSAKYFTDQKIANYRTPGQSLARIQLHSAFCIKQVQGPT